MKHQHNDIIVLMLPLFDPSGNLPPGIHPAAWQEFVGRFGTNSHRLDLLNGMRQGLESLRSAGCATAYIDGSFVTDKEQVMNDVPRDFDACWETAGVDPALLDPVLLVFDNGRAAQKAKFRGEFFPASFTEGASGRTFLDFFQVDKNTGQPKGIVALDLRTL